jgi:MFS family permease
MPSSASPAVSVTTPATALRATRRRELPPRLAYLHAGAVIGIALFASATPSPLYEVYRAEWGFSTFMLTVVYALYALGVLTALLLVGRISDEVGRRPVLLASLSALLVATGLFLAADGLGWLIAARTLQGLATGAALGAASAALLELHPRRDPDSAGLANGVFSAGGMASGALIAALLVQYAPAPERLPYVVLLVLFGVLLAGAAAMPEPVADRRPLRIQPQRPSVPPAIRRRFLLAGLGVLSSWSIGGIFLSLGPSLVAHLLETDNHLSGGIAMTALAGSGAVAQVLFHRAAPWRAASLGSIALAGGMAVIVAAISSDVAWLFFVGAVVAGMGFGVAFLGGLRQLMAVVPDHHRAEVMSAFYVVAYAALSVPALLAGLVVRSWGQVTTFQVFGAAVFVLALVVAVEAWRTRPPADAADVPA